MSKEESTETGRAEMEKVFSAPESLTDAEFSYCSGCHHGIINRLIAEVIDELDIRERTVGTAPVGCSVLLYRWFDIDIVQPAHGRVSAVATGLKRSNPENVVFAYQGDGDFASIGTGNSVHAANRGENISVFFINNTIYGMTGGEMAPTSLENQETTTTPKGKNADDFGYPIKMSEMLSQLDAPVYIDRVAVYDVERIKQAKEAIRKSFRLQLEGKGYSLIEFLATCPVNWGMTPVEANERLKDEVEEVFPLGSLKENDREGAKNGG